MDIKNIIGERYGHWKVLSYNSTSKYGHVYFNCQCDCGSIKRVRYSKLKSGESKSCGCKRRELYSNGAYENGKRTKLYNTWLAMRNRCYDKNNNRYMSYGERGIKVCQEWESFENFKSWSLSNGYKDGLTIDRINNNDIYSPSNCRWVDYYAQANNTRKNKYITYNGTKRTIAEWARALNIKYHSFYHLLQTQEGRNKLLKYFPNCNQSELIPLIEQ